MVTDYKLSKKITVVLLLTHSIGGNSPCYSYFLPQVYRFMDFLPSHCLLNIIHTVHVRAPRDREPQLQLHRDMWHCCMITVFQPERTEQTVRY